METSALIFKSFASFLSLKEEDAADIGKTFPIPSFSASIIDEVCREFKKMRIYQNLNALYKINNEVTIIGDIHGNITDLFRLLIKNGHPSKTNYLFLGDYVDRGDYSLECAIFLLSISTLFPDTVRLLRGNHEVREVNEMYGLRKIFYKKYLTDEVWNSLNDAFDYLALAAIVNPGPYFCVHGGISPIMKGLKSFDAVQLPLSEIPPMVKDILWSDPTQEICLFRENIRGKGCIYGLHATLQFFQESGAKCIIRGHQCVMDGIEILQGGRIITVFSSSNYAEECNNCGFLRINNDVISAKSLEPSHQIPLADAVFREVFKEGVPFKSKAVASLNYEMRLKKRRSSSSRPFLPGVIVPVVSVKSVKKINF